MTITKQEKEKLEALEQENKNLQELLENAQKALEDFADKKEFELSKYQDKIKELEDKNETLKAEPLQDAGLNIDLMRFELVKERASTIRHHHAVADVQQSIAVADEILRQLGCTE